jgi:hypothetical protein
MGNVSLLSAQSLIHERQTGATPRVRVEESLLQQIREARRRLTAQRL